MKKQFATRFLFTWYNRLDETEETSIFISETEMHGFWDYIESTKTGYFIDWNMEA